MPIGGRKALLAGVAVFIWATGMVFPQQPQAEPGGVTNQAKSSASAAPAFPAFLVSDGHALEGSQGQTLMFFTVTLVPPVVSGQASVAFRTRDNTAVAPSDYQGTSGVLTFSAGEFSKLVPVDVVADTAPEHDETFFLDLMEPLGAGIIDDQGVGTVLNDDQIVDSIVDNSGSSTLSVSDEQIKEGNPGENVSVSFQVGLSAASDSPVKVSYRTVGGTADSDVDYTKTEGVLVFVPGELAKTVKVPVAPDEQDEQDETFELTLSEPINARLGSPSGQGLILDDDEAPQIRINDISGKEGNTGTAGPSFTISLSRPSAREIAVDYRLEEETAKPGDDYEPLGPGTLTFPPGTLTRFIKVIKGDPYFEQDETFSVGLSNPINARISRGVGRATVVNDDPMPWLTVNIGESPEGDEGEREMPITVYLGGGTSEAGISFDYATEDQSAHTPSDYRATSGHLTLSPRAPEGTRLTIGVPIKGDVVPESDERFVLKLSNLQGPATFQLSETTGRIYDDDEGGTILSGQEGTFGGTTHPRLSTKGSHNFERGDVLAVAPFNKVRWMDPKGALIAILGPPSEVAGPITAGMAFDDSGNLYVTTFGQRAVDVYDNQGKWLKRFGATIKNAMRGQLPESLLFDNAGNIFVGLATNRNNDPGAAMVKLDPSGKPTQKLYPMSEARGIDWIDLAEDQCTLFYTSEGKGVKRFDVCKNEQLPDFVSPVLPGAVTYALRVLPDGGVLVADTEMLIRISPLGVPVQTYTVPGSGVPVKSDTLNSSGNQFYAMNLDPDGTSFWTQDMKTGQVYKFDIESGRMLLQFNSPTRDGNIKVGGLAIAGECTEGAGCPTGIKAGTGDGNEKDELTENTDSGSLLPREFNQDVPPPPATTLGPAVSPGTVNVPSSQPVPSDPPAAVAPGQHGQQLLQEPVQQAVQGSQQSQAQASQASQGHQVAPGQAAFAVADKQRAQEQVAEVKEPSAKSNPSVGRSPNTRGGSTYLASARETNSTPSPLFALLPPFLAGFIGLTRPQRRTFPVRPQGVRAMGQTKFRTRPRRHDSR